MVSSRQIEIFSSGCPVCDSLIARVREMACPSCEITVLDMNDADVAARAISFGITSLPAVAIDGALVDYSAGRGPDDAALRAAGLGQALA